jgi:hypothetical protein
MPYITGELRRAMDYIVYSYVKVSWQEVSEHSGTEWVKWSVDATRPVALVAISLHSAT